MMEYGDSISRMGMVTSIDTELTYEKMLEIIKGADPRLAKGVLSRSDLILSDELISYCMSSNEPEIRMKIAQCAFVPTQDQILAGLCDQVDFVRLTWAYKTHFTPNERHVSIGLSDKRKEIRTAWVERMDWTPDDMQIKSGLLDSDQCVREAWAKRLDWTPTLSQVSQGIRYHNTWRVRYAWAKRADFTPSRKQVAKGLKDPDEDVRLAWSLRRDYTPSTEQIRNGLEDVDEKVRDAWIKKIESMTEEHMRGDDESLFSI